jgi:hypothetical protein
MQDQPNDELNTPNDPAKLGSDQGSGFNTDDDARAMPRTPLNAVDASDEAGARSPERDGSDTPLGSAFDQQRRQGAMNDDSSNGTAGQGEGMGHTGSNGDEDRGYDENGLLGGVGSSGGLEDFSDRVFPDSNPFTGGYGGSDYDQPSEEQTQHLGLNTPNPIDTVDSNQDNPHPSGPATV